LNTFPSPLPDRPPCSSQRAGILLRNGVTRLFIEPGMPAEQFGLYRSLRKAFTTTQIGLQNPLSPVCETDNIA